MAMHEETFDLLRSIHLGVGHGCLKKMMPAVLLKYRNISHIIVEEFLKTCSRCVEGKPRIASRAGHTPIISKGFNTRSQVDLIDMQSVEQDGYKYIMVYVDPCVKFAHLRRLKSKQSSNVAAKLLKIFSIQGAPGMLHSDNGEEFVSSVITDLAKLWAELKLINGRPRHSESQGAVERLDRTIQDVIKCGCKSGCTNNRCACKKAKLPCNSRCQQNMAWSNKV